MQKIKVAHVINSMGLHGVPTIVFHFLKALRKNYKPYLYCLKKYSDYSDVREEQVKQFRELGVKVFFPDKDEKKFYVVGDLCRWILRNRIDILHTHSYKPNIFLKNPLAPPALAKPGLVCSFRHIVEPLRHNLPSSMYFYSIYAY